MEDLTENQFEENNSLSGDRKTSKMHFFAMKRHFPTKSGTFWCIVKGMWYPHVKNVKIKEEIIKRLEEEVGFVDESSIRMWLRGGRRGVDWTPAPKQWVNIIYDGDFKGFKEFLKGYDSKDRHIWIRRLRIEREGLCPTCMQKWDKKVKEKW